MTDDKKYILALDVGERRIGVAYASKETRVPAPLTTLEVDGGEIGRLEELLIEYPCATLVIGLPRNQNGQETPQTAYVRQFVTQKVAALRIPTVFQDESLTSVAAEDYLQGFKKIYQKADIDMYA